jgi:peptidyl-prolyl cis-trans isomerase B (cyclophilin B)
MLGCLLLAAGTPEIGRQLLQFESQRSLGDGALGRYLASPDASLAQRAALAIGRTRLPAGVALLEAHLGDPRPGVRAASIYGLGLIGLGTGAAAMAEGLGNDASGAVRVAELDALGRYEVAGRLNASDEALAAAAVRAALGSDPDPLVRGRAAIALGFFAAGTQAEPCVEALAAATNAKDAGVRVRAMWTLFRYYAIRVPREVLRKGLHDPDEVVRIEAVRAYGRLKNPDAIPDVKPLLSDPSWRVQEQASEAIIALKGASASASYATTSWTAIPSFVHIPERRPDSLAHFAPLPRPSTTPAAPNAQDAELGMPLVLQTAAQMLGPAKGPHPRLRIVTTQGNIYVMLYPEWAPMTVANFLNLTNAGFYDDNRWFRIVPDFVVQTGEKDDKNAPGPGYTIPAEENPLEQNSYVISMGLNYDDKTNTPLRDSAGSEYYITLSPQYHLDNDFTVFGAVTSGFDVLGRLVESDRVIRIERIADATLDAS